MGNSEQNSITEIEDDFYDEEEGAFVVHYMGFNPHFTTVNDKGLTFGEACQKARTLSKGPMFGKHIPVMVYSRKELPHDVEAVAIAVSIMGVVYIREGNYGDDN